MRMEQFAVTPVDEPKKKRSRKSIILLVTASVLFVLAIGAAGVLGYQNAAQQSQMTQLEADKKQLNEQIAKLKNDVSEVAAGKQASDDAPKGVGELNTALAALVSQRVDITSYDEETILALAQKHFNVSSLPEGATVLVAFAMDKPGTAPTGDVYAAVYWPKNGDEPAQFVAFEKPGGAATWQYRDMY